MQENLRQIYITIDLLRLGLQGGPKSENTSMIINLTTCDFTYWCCCWSMAASSGTRDMRIMADTLNILLKTFDDLKVMAAWAYHAHPVFDCHLLTAKIPRSVPSPAFVSRVWDYTLLSLTGKIWIISIGATALLSTSGSAMAELRLPRPR